MPCPRCHRLVCPRLGISLPAGEVGAAPRDCRLGNTRHGAKGLAVSSRERDKNTNIHLGESMRNAMFAAATWLVSAALSAAPEPDMAAFAALPLVESPRLSPDGQRYASLLSTEESTSLAIVPVYATDGKPLKLQLGVGSDLIDWHWVNDDWLIATVASSLRVEGQDFRVRRAFGVSARDATITRLAAGVAAQEGADILWLARDGTPRALIAVQQSFYVRQDKYYPEVFEVDVSTGKLASRARPVSGVVDWYADHSGNVRMGIRYSADRSESRLLYRDRNGEQFRTIDVADKDKGRDSLTIPALFRAESDKALAYSSKSGFSALYELDIPSLELGKEIFSVPGYDIGNLRTDPAGVQLLGVNYTDTQPRTQWLDPVMSKVQRDLDKAVGPDLRARIVSMSRNQRQLIVLASSPSNPGTYYYVDLDKRSMTEIAPVNPSLRGVPSSEVRTFRYSSRDGLQIEAVLTLPRNREPRNLPLVVMPHGGPASRDAEEWDWWAQYTASLGYAVAQPNYRGSSGYGHEFLEKGDGQWGLAMQDDLLDAIDHLASQGIADPGRVCIVGGSYGGYAALRAAQRDGPRYRCAISFAGISDLNGMLHYDGRFLFGNAWRTKWREAAPDLRAVSPISAPEQFGAPVLLVHGAADLRVPVEQSRKLASSLRRAGKDVRYVEQPKGDHHLSRTEDRLQLLQEMTDFLRKYNP